jgi:hypothetical protein
MFKSDEELIAYIKSRCEVAVGNARDKVEKKADNKLIRYYGEYQPEMYLRTSSLLNALKSTPVSSSGSTIRAAVYMDEGSLNYSSKPIVHTYKKDRIISAKPEPSKTLNAAMKEGTHGGYGSGTAVWTDFGDIKALLADELRKAGVPIK